MKKIRVVITLNEGETINELFGEHTDIPVKCLVDFPEDNYAADHLAPLGRLKGEEEKFHYNNGFYFRLSTRFKELYRTYTVDVDSVKEAKALQQFLKSKSSKLQRCYRDGYIRFLSPPTDPEFKKQKAIFDKLGIESAWDLAREQGEGVLVSIIDTGVMADHPDLRDNLWKNSLDGSIGFAKNGEMSDNRPSPGHGTSVCGIIGALTNNLGVVGIAPRVSLMVHKLQLNGEEAFMSECETAIDLSVRNKARIINCSFEVNPGVDASALSSLQKTINANSDQALFVFSAGNSDINVKNTFLNNLKNVLKVGVVDANDFRLTGTFGSNFGSEVVYGYDKFHTTISDPSRTSLYGAFGFTSAAAPQVSAVSALMCGRKPNLTPARIKEVISLTCDSLPHVPRSEGVGKINARKAMEAIKNDFA